MKHVFIQVLCTGILSGTWFTTGMVYTWPATMLSLFKSTNTTLHRPMAKLELSLMDSLSSIGALVTTPLAGYLLNRFGRKYCTLAIALVNVITYTILSVCNRVEAVLLSMLLSGFGGCIYSVIPIYLNEICHESIRGAMTSISMACIFVGMAVTYWLGGVMKYYTLLYLSLCLSVLALVLLLILKDSPLLLVQKGLEKQAASSIAFYEGVDIKSKQVQNELKKLRRIVHPSISDSPENEEILKPEFKKSREKLPAWKFFKQSRATRRAVLISNILWILSIFQGSPVIQVYAPAIFEKAVPSMSPTLSSVVLSVIGFVAMLTAAYLIEVVGRKPLMIYSSITAGVCCVLLGTQMHCPWAPPGVTAVLIQLYCFSVNMGSGTVPYVYNAEIFLPEVKSVLSILAMEFSWMWTFIACFIYFPLESVVGLGGVFYFYAAVCFIAVLFCIYFMPETKGLSIDAVQILWEKGI